MQRRFCRICPVCGQPDLKNISTHLLQVHGLSSEKRKPYFKQTLVSSRLKFIVLYTVSKITENQSDFSTVCVITTHHVILLMLKK